ncbi:MAG: hypothetical protein HQ530_03720 [Parcubacteria group bacterium]|nr:hypothetical protein [Parcubacteria group bacterium]
MNQKTRLLIVAAIAIMFIGTTVACSSTDTNTSSTDAGKKEKKSEEKKEEIKVTDPEIIKLSDSGQQASDKFTLEKGLSVIKMTHTGQSNFSVTLLDSDGNYIDLLANDIGNYSGSRAVQIPKSGEYVFDVSADGKWDMEIKQPRNMEDVENINNFTGSSPMATDLFKANKGLNKISLTHSGTSNFSVTLLDKKGNYIELIVNEIGSFDGSKAVTLKDEIYIFDVQADGEWSINIE